VIDHGEQSYRGRRRLEGLTALITDAHSDLGRAVALAFSREGADVAVSHSGTSDRPAHTVKAVPEPGRRSLIFEADLTTAEGRSTLVNQAARDVGRIHVLVVNTAFDWLHAVAANADVTERERVFRTSLEAALQFSLEISPHMADGGSIILTAPMRHAHPVESVRALAANARAIQSITASLANSLATRRIRVNAIVPGPMQESRLLDQLPQDARSTFGAETLLRRAAQPFEIAPAFVFLASPQEAGFVNGATLEVTGGASAPLPALE
jgi:NAD(P)-dependent dehydrogenase (short-subunit alcohol dehydrogenase family)